ncbi:MAG: hypothetical protein IKF48_05800 [Oscillospiraceae bacterium]|nr:hypothetical protein [Oscillospiraceae bacterium]
MKKFFAMLLLVCMILSLAACGQQAAPAPAAEQPAAEEPAAEAEAPAEAAEEPAAEEPAAAEYKLGMGVSLNMNSSKAGNAQVDATVAAVVTDAEGKIVAVKLDVAQNKMDITDGQVETDKEFKTKLELGDDYNMVKFSDAVAEWYDQAAAFEAYVIGKTADEVAGTETVVNDEGHTVVTDETLYASCSISVGDFIEAIVKACNDDQAQTFTADEFKLGLAAITEIDAATKAATADEDGLAAMYTDFAAAVVDGEGKIIVAITDAVQPKISFDAAGEITDTAFAGTKRELKEDYNMVKFSDATLEWYQQAQNFVDYAAGKTAEELRASETTLNEEGHQVFVDEALYASVSISVDGMINVVAKAADNAA